MNSASNQCGLRWMWSQMNRFHEPIFSGGKTNDFLVVSICFWKFREAQLTGYAHGSGPVVKQKWTKNKYDASSYKRTAQQSSICEVLDYHTDTFVCKCVRSLSFEHTARCNDFRAGLTQSRACFRMEIVWEILQIMEKFHFFQ